ncbi:21 kDa subunit of NADH dehydrogenase [Piedraia hortae CBS 480.64]|uniref:21 kDa subunit of NADH dehydrogenase n=1 Tax=Piedraia hortae CBS 480.64 TaxID=1314780 RepID=A0A6A7CA30_9PEZI|nr:21 kDa subunit of NADH dehydrogenase [Piedraia hortae CBS 480.64]
MSAAKSVVKRVGQATRATNYQKYTLEPTGIWAWFNRFFALDPARSSGVPINAQFRNPTPGGDYLTYDDPTTTPAADIADNPYWKRDTRRNYPRLSVVGQPDAVALLTVGSAAAPKEDVLQIGEAGQKQLVALKDEGQKGLSQFFQKEKGAVKGVLAANGMPPLPPPVSSKQYDLPEDQAYANAYPCRTFV